MSLLVIILIILLLCGGGGYFTRGSWAGDGFLAGNGSWGIGGLLLLILLILALSGRL